MCNLLLFLSVWDKNNSKMSFCIVQTRKRVKSKPILTVVPKSWVDGSMVFWPKNRFVSLSTDKNALPDKLTWTSQPCKVLGKVYDAYADAEDAVIQLTALTDSEDAMEMSRGTRNTPAEKKKKFESKSYNLLQKQPSAIVTNPEEMLPTAIGPSKQNPPTGLTAPESKPLNHYPNRAPLETESNVNNYSLFNMVEQSDEENAYQLSDSNGPLKSNNNNKECSFCGGNNSDAKIHERLDALEREITLQRVASEKILQFMADFTKLMQKKSAPISAQCSKEIEAEEGFSEFEDMGLIETEADKCMI